MHPLRVRLNPKQRSALKKYFYRSATWWIFFFIQHFFSKRGPVLQHYFFLYGQVQHHLYSFFVFHFYLTQTMVHIKYLDQTNCFNVFSQLKICISCHVHKIMLSYLSGHLSGVPVILYAANDLCVQVKKSLRDIL